MAKVSVIIPVWNRPQMLYRSLISVLTQTHEDLEVLIMGDGCPQSVEEDYLKVITSCRDDRIVWYNIEKHNNSAWANSGIWARNCGLDLAKGSFIAPLDDDDMWTPFHLETSLEAMRDPEIGFVHGQWLDLGARARMGRLMGDAKKIGHLTAVYRAEHKHLKYPETDRLGSDYLLWELFRAAGVKMQFDERVHGVHYSYTW